MQAAGAGGSGEAAAEGGEDSGGDSSSESGSGAGSGAGILKKEEEDDPLGVAREVVPRPAPRRAPAAGTRARTVHSFTSPFRKVRSVRGEGRGVSD